MLPGAHLLGSLLISSPIGFPMVLGMGYVRMRRAISSGSVVGLTSLHPFRMAEAASESVCPVRSKSAFMTIAGAPMCSAGAVDDADVYSLFLIEAPKFGAPELAEVAEKFGAPGVLFGVLNFGAPIICLSRAGDRSGRPGAGWPVAVTSSLPPPFLWTTPERPANLWRSRIAE